MISFFKKLFRFKTKSNKLRINIISRGWQPIGRLDVNHPPKGYSGVTK